MCFSRSRRHVFIKYILLLLLNVVHPGSTFLPVYISSASSSSSSRSLTIISAEKKPETTTLRDLMNEFKRSPDMFIAKDPVKRSHRTRKRVTNPKQKYIYAAQRRFQTATPKSSVATTPTKAAAKETKKDNSSESAEDSSTIATTQDPNCPLHFARQLGLLNPGNQHCDLPIAAQEPQILGQVQVSEDRTKASSYAYIIEKPAGWSILGREKTQKQREMNNMDDDNSDEDENETDDDLDSSQLPDEVEPFTLSQEESKLSMAWVNDSGDVMETLEWDMRDMLAVMTDEEIAEFQAEGGFDLLRTPSSSSIPKSSQKNTERPTPNVKTALSSRASFESFVRPSVVSWLKKIKAEEGTPIRGGKHWTAVAGAINVDDSGLVVLCPKDKVDKLFIDSAKYIAVVGTGKFLAPKPKGFDDEKAMSKESTEIEIIAKLRRGRAEDTVFTVGILIAGCVSNCNHAVQICQEKLLDGVRGDPAANPFDRRASRRLVHCDAITASSLDFDDETEVESEFLPDDVAVVANRRDNHEFADGSFLGRSELLENPYTNAYREIDGAADGFPGWTVDRYDKWLWVQHDEKYPRGPLPSIHDGNTVGVYYLPAESDRNSMGLASIRPVLLEGIPAPQLVPIQENGVTYLVSLGEDLSTGIFLDQRPQRAWLTRHCNSKTRVLNCFAHCGAYSVAAASAGASTLSLDLNKKFLDRIPSQLEMNGIDSNDGRHDTIFGDCFDWLGRLAKRGEKFDLVILDPPSTSIGIKKKRWSIKNDMAELVSLAAPMVKSGGLLWTTTNSATIPPIKFAKMCQKGLDSVGLRGSKLERVVPMPGDFLCLGTPRVKNLIWRIP